MPKKNTNVTTIKKPKLTPEQRSDVAKARWAKKRETDAVQEGTTPPPSPPYPQNPSPEQPPVAPESQAPEPQQPPTPIVPPVPYSQGEQYPSVPLMRYDPVPQLTPVAPKKPKRYTGPKEFSVALKAAESRLAKAIHEHAEALGKYNSLQAEIPYLLGIIKSLKGEQPSPLPPSFVMPQFPSPMPQFQTPYDPLAAIQGAAAMPPVSRASGGAMPPVSRASGGAMQFGPEVFGELEGSEDDDDKFIQGPAAGSKGWV